MFAFLFALPFQIFSTVVCILLIVAYWRLNEKAGEAGWKSLIPFYNVYIQFKFAWGNGWSFLLLLIPFANIVFLIMFWVKLAHAFGKGGGFAAGLFFLPNIFTMILAFGSAQYIGPDGKPVQPYYQNNYYNQIPNQDYGQNQYQTNPYQNYQNPYQNSPNGGQQPNLYQNQQLQNPYQNQDDDFTNPYQ